MKKRRSLVWILYAALLAAILATLGAAAWIVSGVVARWSLAQTESSLEAEAWLFSAAAGQLIAPERAPELQRLTRAYGARAKLRLSVIRADGTVVADSDEDPSAFGNHADRPEIAAALAGEVGSAVRHSATIGLDMVYVAVPAASEEDVRFAVRAAVPLTQVHELYESEVASMAVAGGIVLVAAALLAWLLAFWLNRPLRRLRAGFERLGAGDLRHRLPVPNVEEYAALAETANRMAAQLEERVRIITDQRNESDAVLAGMVEAVIVVDADDRLVRMNRAAGLLFGVNPEGVRGKSLYRVIRDPDLQGLVNRTRTEPDVVEAEIVPKVTGERILQAHGTSLPDDRGRPAGALLVLNDVTRLKRLESMRRDFVANVSHELRTPITSIQGFVETLKDGALKDPADAARFLDIIARHTDRLNAIIEDLLALSRIEKESEHGPVAREAVPVRPVLEAAVALCAPLAAERRLRVEIDCAAGLAARINAPLVEQAVVNLVDNALKFTDPGAAPEVAVAARRDEGSGELVVEVRDRGCGIAAEHLPRIFERFYRVDKARSRTQGGTGLGLSIVKHIAQAHGGAVAVASRPGEGSAFTLRVPS